MDERMTPALIGFLFLLGLGSLSVAEAEDGGSPFKESMGNLSGSDICPMCSLGEKEAYVQSYNSNPRPASRIRSQA